MRYHVYHVFLLIKSDEVTIVASNPVATPQIYNMAADNQEKVWIKLALMGELKLEYFH